MAESKTPLGQAPVQIVNNYYGDKLVMIGSHKAVPRVKQVVVSPINSNQFSLGKDFKAHHSQLEGQRPGTMVKSTRRVELN